jgi:hypothetical protein
MSSGWSSSPRGSAPRSSAAAACAPHLRRRATGARAVFTAAEDIDAAEAEEAARARADFFGGPPVSAHAEPAAQPDVAPNPSLAPVPPRARPPARH